MSFRFTEQFTVALPDNLVEDHTRIQESVKEAGTDAGLIVEIAAIHAGYTENNTFYSAEELTKSIPSWIDPYPKPVIMNHDLKSEPVGRVVGAKMAQEADGKDYIRIQAAITDPEAITKVLDKRYITGSVGGKAEQAFCNICNTDWAVRESASALPCKHAKGRVYNGVVAALDLKGLSFKEYSFVNAPADSNSYIRSIGEPGSAAVSEDDDSTWVKPSKFFLYSLADHKIKEYSDSKNSGVFVMAESASDYLEGILDLDNKNHSSLFVNNESTQDTNQNVKSSLLQEFFMENEVTEQEEDILAVTEQLSDDLVAENETSTDGDDNVDSAEADTVEESDEQVDSVDEANEAESKESEDDTETTEEVADEAADTVEEVEAEDKEADKPEDETDVVDETKEDETEVKDSVEDKEDDTNGLDTKDSVEPEVASLVQENASLKEENAKLRKALHRTLAERVVDTKISLGIEELDARTSLIEEHATRGAGSLADSLRDLAKLPQVQKQVIAAENLNLKMGSVSVEDTDEPSFTEDTHVEEKTPVKPGDVFVDKMANILSGNTNFH